MASTGTGASHLADQLLRLLSALVMLFFRGVLLAWRRARFVLLRRPGIILLRRIRLGRPSRRLMVVLGTRRCRRSLAIRTRAGRIRLREWPESLAGIPFIRLR